MIPKKYFYIGVVFVLLALMVLFTRTMILENVNARKNQQYVATITAMQDSLQVLINRVRALQNQTPGLGEYMTSVQLHTGKLWFAAQANNWSLAQYELDELTEALQAAEGLHVVKNNVQISPVLRALRETQLVAVDKSIKSKSMAQFITAYKQTLETCNACHKSAQYQFIHIIVPTAPPVTNQDWKGSRQ
ncbi:MAG: hypothetical protein HY276_00635 [Ignavibacteriales bacterium]|nr:hypothetical protein [Ignavibacteriales bacterium]MBI3786740.1 hypothetical protein [Ignavibacteriales bacterium]